MAYLYEAEIHVARARILYSLGSSQDAETELERAEEICAEVADKYGSLGLHLPDHITPSAEIADIWDHFYERAASWAQWEAEDARMISFQERYPKESRKPAWVYCPRGHNAVFSETGYDECAACGAPMTPADEEPYFNKLCAAGHCM
ncbi:hypothetical protein A5904_14635 (plasmid) [Acidithiobacillus caldus]|uniref:hypothetical protein n=1 Tax=Acidithiobacillus caldus TaxID=33059 RepID=UPI0005A02990|nr:hypothetical protein [Acidithiobacillus caldus]AUW34183.1 hypothetical protein A5904_14635 [Acidithiobacillus caldus]QER43361.1 hypothetical protein F0726_00272 [Acidithiobacillus caldus]